MARSPVDPSDLSALSSLAPALAAAFASLTGDIALVIDGAGVIREVAVAEAASADHASDWVGRSFAETVTGETRRKIEQLLKETGAPGVTRRREVNHPSHGGDDIPVSYTALRLGLDGPVIAVGRDLRAVAAIQQRFVEAQQELERDYWKLRQDATRRQLLAQVATDAVLVVDGATLRVLEANPAAEALFGAQGDGLPQAARELLSKSAQAGRGAEIRTRLAPSLASTQVDLSVTPFRVAPAAADVSPALRLLLRARSAHVDGTGPAGCAVAVTDSRGRVLAANSGLRALCRPDVDPIEGRSLVDALGDPQRHLASLLADVRRDGLVHRASVVLGGGRAPTSACTVDAALMNDGEQEGIGFTFMPLEQAPPDTARDALLALLEQGGDVPLPALMQRVAELAERHAVEAALRRAADDRSDPAAMLGVSDADLAERMRRLGLVR